MENTTNTCPIENEDPLLDSGNCSGTTTNQTDPNTPPTQTDSSCTITPNGQLCPSKDNCSPFDLTESPEACIISDYIEETLNIGGAILNVHKLLGVHEQGSLEDVTGTGSAIASGSHPNFPAQNAFDKFITEWRSVELGSNVLKSFIGYDFGPIRLSNGRQRYGTETYVKRDISTLRIKQGCNKNNRATRVRVERSSDGKTWFGAAVINLQDCDGLITVNFKRTVPSRWWRLRPISFNGGSEDYWSVQALQFLEYEATHISNIQDKIFLENRDRDYSEFSVEIKGQYTPNDVQTSVGKWGAMFDLDKYSFEVSFAQVVQRLGRPFVIGDIVQLPSETQFTPTLKPVLKYLEVTDVAWSVNGFTPTWVPTLQRITAKPVLASQETQDILGKLTRDLDDSGLSDIDDGLDNKKYQDMHDIAQTINADANTAVPVKGEDYANVTKFSEEMLEFSDAHPNMNLRKFDRNRSLFGVDAMPPNGLPYTEGDAFPENPKDGDWHRLTYTNIGQDIPTRLHRYSSAKQRWIFLEIDNRTSRNDDKPLLKEFTKEETSSRTPENNSERDTKPN